MFAPASTPPGPRAATLTPREHVVKPPRSSRRGVFWAFTGALVLMVGVGALLLGSFLGSRDVADPPLVLPATPPSTEPTPALSTSSAEVEAVIDRGWVAEPSTTDVALYVRSAISAAGTFDTQKSSYEQWLTYLGTWFTPDTRYTSAADRDTELAAAKLEMRQEVVLPQSAWNSLAAERGRIASVVVSDVALGPVAQDASGDMAIGTAEVVITYTRSDGGDGEVTFDESARVSVQVLCGPSSVPAPNSTQKPGDCKVVRFLTDESAP